MGGQNPVTGEDISQLLFQELPGHHDALDLAGALVDLDDRGLEGSFRR
jgi:hypothetical protein